jgi:4-hydroxy-tetrahydrodipicolinate reductase
MTNYSFKYGIIGSTGKLGRDVNTILSENGGSPVLWFNRSGEYEIGKPDLLIDCSLPEALDKTISLAYKFNVPLIVATTALNEDQLKKLKKLGETIPVIQSYNFSVGIQILLNLVDKTKDLIPDWDVEIEETHHRFKRDRPSGTAKMIRNIFKDQSVNISSLRLGTTVGEHTVYFGGLEEVLSIKHTATSRKTFAHGILKAIEFSLNKKNGFFSFADVIYSDPGFQI